MVTTNGNGFDESYIVNELHITDGIYQTAPNTFLFSALTEESATRLKQNPVVTSITKTFLMKVRLVFSSNTQ